MRAAAAVLAILAAIPLHAQSVYNARGGFVLDAVGWGSTWTGAVYRDVPKHTELGAEAVRVGALWINHDGSYLEVPAMHGALRPLVVAAGIGVRR